MDKRKKFNLNLEIFRDIFQICPGVHGQNFDTLPTNEDIVSFFKELGHTGEIKTITDIVVDQMHQPWRTFATIINRSLSGKKTGLDKLHLSRAHILWAMYYKKNLDYVELLWEDFTYQINNIVSKRINIGIHTSRDNYLINMLKFISTKEESQIYRAGLPESMTSPEMRESKAYKTYLGYATEDTPPKKARKFKKPASPKLTTILVSPKEPTRKSKRIIDQQRSLLMCQHEVLSLEKLLGSGTFTKIAPSAIKIKPSVTNEGMGAKPGVLNVTKEESTESEAESWGRDEDDNNNEHDSSSEGNDQEKDTDDEKEKDDKFVKTPSNSTDDEDETNDESKVKDIDKGDEDEGMDYTTDQFDDDVDLRMNEPVTTDEWFIQKEGTDAKIINVQQGNENPEITLNQVIEDAHVTLSTITKKTEVPVTSSSYSSDLASKFLDFLDIPHTDAEIVSLIDVHIQQKVPSKQTTTLLTVPVSVITDSSHVYSTVIPQSLPSFTPPPQQSTLTPSSTTKATNPPSALPNFASVFQFNNRVTTLEKEVVELKKGDPLNTQVTSLVDEHLDSRLGATKDKFMNYMSASITARITEQVKI
ncbi:hypothetical protein Tco_0547671 [Tanacetum coccineum]